LNVVTKLNWTELDIHTSFRQWHGSIHSLCYSV